MKRTLGGALLAAALFLGGCTPPPFVSPAQGGPKWSMLTTRHFTLYTDVPEDEAREMGGELEEIYRSFEDVAFPYTKKPTGRFEVTLFQREDAYVKVAPPGSRGYLQRSAHDPDNRPMMVLYHGVDPRLRTVLRHELAHRFVAFYFPAAPLWLNEGLAKTYETLTFKGGEALVGALPDSRRFGINSRITLGTDLGVVEATRGELPSVAALIAADHKQFYAQSESPLEVKRAVLHYEAAWNLVHVMRFGPPPLREAFEEYLLSLIKGREPRAAFDEALRRHNIDSAQLESAYRQHIELYGVPAERVVFTPRDVAVPHGRAMTEAEVRLLWARIRPWRGVEGMKWAGEEVEAAIKADPSFAPAYILRGEWFERQHRDREALADYRKARSLGPEDFRTAHALASYLNHHHKDFAGDAGVEAELNGLLEGLRQNAGSAAAWDTLARYDARRGDPERGLPFARKAISANPSCFECYDTAAMLFYRLGRLDEALAAQRTAVNLIPDGVRVPGMLKRLHELEGEFASRPPAPPSADAAPAKGAAGAGQK